MVYTIFVTKSGQISITKCLEFGLNGDPVCAARNDSNLILAIRPLSPTTAWPSDDLILEFNLRRAGTTANLLAISKAKPESDYLAVYDKKMLWRANLYLAETGAGGPASTDWNDLHPWNAPPADGSTVADTEGAQKPVADVSPWWSAVWGYNEWNRTWNATGATALGFVGLNSLDCGNGGQVLVSFPLITPLRTIGGTRTIPNNTNYLADTVAYSYPMHPNTATTSSGLEGSQDSPFDYIKKLLVQKGLLSEMYNADGEKYLQPRSSWPAALRESTSAEDWTRTQFITYVASLPAAIVTEAQWIVEKPSYNRYFQRWTTSRAPGNRWWNYAYVSTAPAADTLTRSLIPSLGLLHLSDTLVEYPTFGVGATPAEKLSAARTAMWSRNWVYEAGMDCVGFANRAASWSGEQYSWTSLKDGWTEQADGNGTDDLTDIFAGDPIRSYPLATTESVCIVSRKVSTVTWSLSGTTWIAAAVPSLTAQPSIDALRRVVPGDIWIKDSYGPKDQSNGVNNTEFRDHIAIVASVPIYVEGMTVQDFMAGMILMEGEYSGKIQTVINQFSVNHYNMDRQPNGMRLYNGSVTLSSADSLRCEAWAIQRLK